jgi:hypothetical protein
MRASERGAPHADLFYNVAEVELVLGRREAAEISVHKALALNSQHAASRSLLAQLQPSAAPEQGRTYMR